MNNEFIDRDELREELVNIIKDIQFNNIVYILSAKTGYGKSAFCQNVIDNIKGDYICHKISIPAGHNISLDEGFYFRSIASTVSENSYLYNYMSLDDFIRNTKNSLVKKMYHEQIIDDISETFSIIKPLSTVYKKNNELDNNKKYEYLFPEDTRYIYPLLLEYMVECFIPQKKIVINIENVQQIDALSLLKIKELLKRCNNIFLLLEYTSDSDSLDQAKKFESNFYSEDIKIITKKLKKLDFHNTCKVLENLYPNDSNLKDEKIRNEIYFTIKGNLRQLSDIDDFYLLSSDQVERKSVDNINYTRERLQGIKDKNKIQLLALIIAHMTSVPVSILKDLLSKKMYIAYLNLDDLLSSLSCDNGFLKFENYTVSLTHDSIRQIFIEIPKFEIKLSLAYSWWIEYYEKKFENNHHDLNNTDIIKKLCFFYSNYPPESDRILLLLPNIREIALNCCNPEEAISFLLNFFNYIDNINSKALCTKLNYFLLDLYYELGLYDNAYTIFKHMTFKQQEIRLLYEAILQNRLQKCQISINIIDKGLNENKENTHFILCANLIKLIAAASSNNYRLCEDTFNLLITDNRFENYFEYGFLLRNSEIVCPLRESVEYLEKSVLFFKERNCLLYEAHSRISLIMNYSRIGEFEKAEEHLTISRKLLKNKSLERHILLNDEIAYNMCKGNFDLDFQNDLKLAMCTANYIFDKIVINKNLLIIYTKNQCWEQGEEIVEFLLELIGKETNKLNICFTYWNISYFYKHYDSIQYEFYYKKYKKLYTELLKRPMRKSVLETDVYHKPNMEFVIEFISYWHFPIPKTL